MRKMMIAVAALLGLAGTANAAELLTNGGFETGTLAGWTARDGTPVVTTDRAHSGRYAAAADGGSSIVQRFAPTATAQIAEISFWVQRDGGIFNAYQFLYEDALPSAFFLVSGQSSDWSFFDVTANLAADRTLSGLLIYGTSPGPAYLDDFSVRTIGAAVPEPASWALLILGFGAVGHGLRRRTPRPAPRFA